MARSSSNQDRTLQRTTQRVEVDGADGLRHADLRTRSASPRKHSGGDPASKTPKQRAPGTLVINIRQKRPLQGGKSMRSGNVASNPADRSIA
jgi:hypothetical protein